jgi:hypothetical protein
MYKKFALMLFLATGALAFQATAAMAGWKPYGNINPITSSSSIWKCGATQSLGNGTNVGAQVCTVRSSDRQGVQGAVIVRNDSNYLYSTSASMTVYNQYARIAGNWSCSSSGVAANSWSVCFGTTFPVTSGYTYTTEGYAKNTWLKFSGYN